MAPNSTAPASTLDPLQFQSATATDIPTIRRLADLIWRACYPAILSPAQIDHMLAWMYSPEKIEAELHAGIEYFLARHDGSPIGYLAIELPPLHSANPTPQTTRVATLHKLYLDPAFHGQGLGSQMLQFAIHRTQSLGASSLSLRVNKRNAPALAAYQRNGFQIVDALTVDIGAGFVMDDFLLVRPLHSPQTSR